MDTRLTNVQRDVLKNELVVDHLKEEVLMDIQMPVMDGYTATQRIRALNDPARAAVPIVAMTANVFEEERKRAFDCGMNAFLSKPLVIDALIAALQDILH